MAKSNARVPLVERETVPAADLPAYDHVAKSRGAGRMPNVFKALANNPAVMERVAAVGEYMRFQSNIDPQLRELAILTTAQEIRCTYEWTAHYTIAQKLGVSAKLLSSVGTPQIESESVPLVSVVKNQFFPSRPHPSRDAREKLKGWEMEGGL
jgi:alkylhydroperoxidase family enzyme